MQTNDNKNVSTRQAVPADIREIARLQIDVLQDEFAPDQSLQALFVNELEKRWRKQLQNGAHVLVLLEEGKIIGFISYTVNLTDMQQAEINHFCIIPHKRRLGLGRSLFNALLNNAQMKHCQSVKVWIVEENSRTTQFYQSLGFAPTSAINTDDIGDGVIIKEIGYLFTID